MGPQADVPGVQASGGMVAMALCTVPTHGQAKQVESLLGGTLGLK